MKIILILSIINILINQIKPSLDNSLKAHYPFDGHYIDITGNNIDVTNDGTTFKNWTTGGVHGNTH